MYNSAMPNLTGKTLGKVRIDMFLARGGMADVYIGTHTTLHRAVAVKFLKGDLQEDQELRARFEREARVIAMLRHPNIVQVYDFDTYENQPYLVMEYIPGTSLAAYLRELHKNGGRLDLHQIYALLERLADALTYAHDNDVIHRDIKPANILLTSRSIPVEVGKPLPTDVEPILTDFGLVRFTQSKVQTSTGFITGTPAYMSPEQARGEKVDRRSDVYSLGITVYEMLAGKVPFDADSAMTVLHMHIYEPPPPIEGIPVKVQKVMDRVLAKDPNQRFQSALEFAEAFHEAITEKAEASTLIFPTSTPQTKTSTPQSATTSKVGRTVNPILIGGIALIVLISAFAMANFFSFTPSVPPTDTPTVALHTEAHTEAASTPSEGGSVSVEPEPMGILRFQDGTAPADAVTFFPSSLPPSPEGTHYEVWLITDDGEGRVSIGTLSDGAPLTFVDPQGRNLIGLYHAVEITIEPSPDNNPNPSNNVAFFAALPKGGFTHVRHLLYSFSATPNQIGFIHGLARDTNQLNESAKAMLASFEAGDEEAMRRQAEGMLNLILGSKSPDYKDWNGDGTVEDFGDGFGLLLNGDNVGYIQGTFTHADLSITSPDATQNMLIHGEHVKISATNVGEWTPLLRDQLIAILNTPFNAPELEGLIRQAATTANQIHSGVDINGNENIEAIPGEGGAMTAYDHSYYMADIFILP